MEISTANAGKLPLAEPATIEEWAALQGVLPVTDYLAFLGHAAPEDETEEEFAEMLRQWRSEKPSPKRSR
jgi:hypothetical protein